MISAPSMGFPELSHMGGLMDGLLQVPDLEVFVLVDGKELTVAGCKFYILQLFCFSFPFRNSLLLLRRDRTGSIVLEVEETPLDLGDRVVAGVVPDCQGRSVVLIVDPKI